MLAQSKVKTLQLVHNCQCVWDLVCSFQYSGLTATLLLHLLILNDVEVQCRRQQWLTTSQSYASNLAGLCAAVVQLEISRQGAAWAPGELGHCLRWRRLCLQELLPMKRLFQVVQHVQGGLPVPAIL
jgi:hypothetical protein